MGSYKFAPDARTFIYTDLLSTLKEVLAGLDVEKNVLSVADGETFVQYTLKNKPSVFLRLSLVPDFTLPSQILTMAVVMHIDSIFRSTVDFYLTENNSFVLHTWISELDQVKKLRGKHVAVTQIRDIVTQYRHAFSKTITHKDILISKFFQEAGVIDSNIRLQFVEEDIVTSWGAQKFRFAIHKEAGKIKVLLDDILSHNLTSVTNAIEDIAFHIALRHFNGNYENIEWFQIFCFNLNTVIQKIELKPHIEARRKALIFKEYEFRGYDSPEFRLVASFSPSESEKIFNEFLIE